MRRFNTILTNLDRTFRIQLNDDSVRNLKVDLEKQEGAPVDMDFTNLAPALNTKVETSQSGFETKSEINNTPTEDDWYDEIIFYDGGGVEGYGY